MIHSIFDDSLFRLFHRSIIYEVSEENLEHLTTFVKEKNMCRANDLFILFALGVFKDLQSYLRSWYTKLATTYHFDPSDDLYMEDLTLETIHTLIGESIVGKIEDIGDPDFDELDENSSVIDLINEYGRKVKASDIKYRDQISTLTNTIIKTNEDDHWDEFLESYVNSQKMTTYLMSFSEHLFFGTFREIIPITDQYTLCIPKSDHQIHLNSLNIGGKIINFLISNIGEMLCNDTTYYADIAYLQSLVSNNRASFKRKQLKKETLKKLYIPLHHANHYSLYVFKIDPNIYQNQDDKMKIYYYDSLQNNGYVEDHVKILIDNIRTQVKHEIPSQYEVIQPSCPKQDNDYDCGIFTILNMSNPACGEGNGDITYNYDDNYRELIRQCLRKRSVKNLIELWEAK